MTKKNVFSRPLIGLAVAACFAGAVHANPTGPAVASGSASFAASGNALTVTNTPGTIINWQQFSIRPDEVTRFIQSGAASAVLNRVTGGDPSAILGQLLSNGRVFLINPNGVVVGAGARIDTAGFVASSLSLSNEDFLAGRFRFTDPGSAGKVTNAGTINARSGGPVYLIAPTIENHGVITAPNGDIILAAGKSVELVAAASPHLRVQLQAGGEAVNVGRLIAESGFAGIYGAAIRNAGTVSADSAGVNAAGNVVLKASRDVTLEATSVVSANGAQGGAVHVQAEGGTLLADGRIEAKGAVEKGGEVKLLGTQVGLVGGASVDASGATGGGTVLVGGDYQGRNPEIQNAARVVLTPDARIAADATERGDGGRVIVWSDEYTGFYGTISARGGAAGGNGGFVETSSQDILQALGAVDAAAPLGRAGEWLLDPSNVTISGAATANGTYSGGSPNIFNTTANTAVANVTTLQNALNAGTSVTINTTPGGTQPGNITLAFAITKSAGTGAALTLNAQQNIALNAGITSNASTLDVNLNAGLGGAGTITLNNMSLNGGTLTVNAPGNVTQAAGTTLQAATSLVKQGTGTLTLSRANTYTGATDINAGTLALGANNVLADTTAVTI
ncbi:MAG: filamentous hemagglutinin N-terminal domain-containing protein, partial [Burkholderiales bacterium]|nr:filamentous hemagglutinin N-terminal domain-containing protein [Burkholderiales bacterium]